MTRRLLVTGSRDWHDRKTIRDALVQAWRDLQPGPIILVHGAARGADQIAADIWASGGLEDEPHPADWKGDGRKAGPIRNQHMVDLGADLCVAFPIGDGWSGTRDCMERARKAGIPVRVIATG
ncbi:SLOG family protein [Nocardia sp. NPDC049707]|uniref:SLOG family protein n=1 Tax=Nocardia sp. NPDC049707 TaxID=3154735 RepID=UPI0034390FA5